MGNQPFCALSMLLLMPADIPEFIEELPDVLPLANKKNEASEQTKPNALGEDQCEMQIEDDDGNQDALQPNIKFASLKGAVALQR
jgi:hypothetical protein